MTNAQMNFVKRENAWLGCYYHFFLEFALRLYYFLHSENLLDREVFVYTEMKENHFNRFKHIQDIIFKNVKFHYGQRCPDKDCLVVDSVNKGGFGYLSEENGPRDHLIRSLNQIIYKEPKYLVLIERGTEGKRWLENHNTLKSNLELYSEGNNLIFKNLRLHNMEFLDQVYYLLNTKILVGEHGAGLSNAYWMRKDTHCLEIQYEFNGSKSVHRNMYRTLCKKLKINYYASYPEKNNVADIENVMDKLKNITQ